MSLYDEYKQDRKKNQNLSLYDEYKQDRGLTDINDTFKRTTIKDLMSDFNEKRKVFDEIGKAKAERTLTDLVGKTKNILDTAGSIGQNIIDDVRQSGAEDLSSYVQRKNQEQAITSLRANPTSPLFDYGTFANEKIKQENRQNARYKSLSEDKKIQQALNLQNNLRTEATPGQKVGYTVGDVVNNFAHSVTQEGTNLLQGLLYWQGDMANAFGDKEKADLLYKLAGTKDAASQYVYEPAQQELEKYSKLDDTGRQVVQGLGQVATKTALSAGGNILAGGLGLTETGTRLFNDIASNTGMFTGSMASARNEAISQGATQDQARLYGYLSGLSETASESMFGGFGKLTDAMGISRGIGGLDEKLSYGLRKNISNAFARNLVNLGVSAIGEGTEEVVSGLANAIWKKLTYLPDEDLRKLIEDEKLADSFVVGMLTSAIFQIPEYTSSSLSGTDMSTGQDVKEAVQNEKINQEYKKMMDNWKKENPEAYKIFKDSQEYEKKYGLEENGSLVESAEKYGYKKDSAEIQATQKILNRTGIEAEFNEKAFGGDKDIEGLWLTDENGNRKVIFNPDAKEKTIFQKVAVHELTHDVLNRDTAESKAFKQDILELISKDKNYTNARAKIEEIYKKLTQDGKPIYDLTTEEGKANFNSVVEEELITNAMAEKFGSQEEINRLIEYKPSLARRIYDKIVEWGKKLTGSEKLYWKDVQNKFEKAYNTQGNIKSDELRASVNNEVENITIDNQGRTLSKEQQDYFKNSKVRDEKGNLLEVYHGTPTGGFNIYNKKQLGKTTQAKDSKLGIHFTDNVEMANQFKDYVSDNVKAQAREEINKKYNIEYGIVPFDMQSKINQEVNELAEKMVKEKGETKKQYLDIKKPLSIFADYGISEEQLANDLVYIATGKKDISDINPDYFENNLDFLSMVQQNFNNELGELKDELATPEAKERIKELGYDGIILPIQTTDKLGLAQSGLNSEGNEYIIFNENQVKNVDNQNPTENPDIRYSIENDSLFGYENKGTKTTLEDLRTSDYKPYEHPERLKERIRESWRDNDVRDRLEKIRNKIENANISEGLKEDLLDNSIYNDKLYTEVVTEKVISDIENNIDNSLEEEKQRQLEREQEYKQRLKEKQQEAKSWAIAKKEADTYDNKTYNLLERLEEKYPTNRNGKRTGKEWYDFANELGQELKKMGKSEQELDKIAKQTWYLYNPGKNRASSNKAAGYENNPVRVFNNSWVKAIKNGYESVNTILPTQAKTENKTILVKENKTISQNEEIKSREPIKTIENKEEIKSIKNITEPKVDIKDGEEAKILSEPLKRENKNRRFWAILKANIIDKGAVFEKISRLTKNRELQGKWDSTLTSGAKAQIAEANARYILDPKTNKETQVSKSLESIRDEVGDNRAAFQEYMYHQLNIDRMTLADRFEGMENKPVFGKFVTADTSRDKVKQLETKYPEFKKYAQDIYDYLNENKRILVNSGVISQELSDKLDKMYPHYVPIQRIDNFKDAIAVPLDTRRTGVNAPLKSAKGGSQDIQPLFTTIQDRTLQTYRASDRNDFGLELMKSLKQLNQLNTTKEDINVDNIIEEITTENGNNELLKKGEKGKNPTFTVFENGKRVTFEINDDIYDALKPKSELLQRIDESKPAKTLRAISNFRRNLITEYNPLFMATNSIKDIQEVLFNSQHALKTYSKVPEAYAQIIKKGTWFKEYMQNGGVQNSYFTEGEFDQPKKSNSIAKKIITAPVNAISNLNEVIELAPRLAEYIASREEGRSIKTSMLDAARVTTNFKAGGDITKTLNRNGATFLNASVQGAAQVVRNFQEANAKGLKGYAVLVTKLTVAGLLPQLINGLIWDDDEDYQNLQDYIKDNYYIVGKVGDTFIRIPKGRAMATVQKIFNNAGEFTTSVGNLDGDKLASAFWKDLQEDVQIAVDNLAPNNPLENNILSPITQVISGKKWHGGDMIPTRLKDKPAVEQYDETTDSLSKFIGEKTGISPIKINYLIDQYSGGLGDVFLPMLTPQAENNPIEDKFTSNAIMKNKYSGEYFDTKEQLTIKSNSEKATDLDKIKASFLNSVQSNKKINANGVTESLSDLYAQKRDIQNSSLPDETKKQQLKDVQRKINTKTEWALKQLDNIKIDGDIAKLNNNLVWCKDDGKWEKIDDKTLGKINDSNISLKKYVQYKQNVTTYKKATGDTNLNTKEEIPLLQKISMSDNDRAGIYKEFVNPQDSFYQAVSVDKNFNINAYLDYKLQDFESDKDDNGKTITNSRKKKVYNYIAQSSFDYPQRLMLTARDYKLQTSEKQYLAKYITNLDISTDEMIAMFDSMGNNFTVYNGQVYFK